MATVTDAMGITHETPQIHVVQVKSVFIEYWFDLEEGKNYSEEDISEMCAKGWVKAVRAANGAVHNIWIESHATDFEEVSYS